MEDVKTRLADEIAARLSGAPDSAAKAELIEELSDNLYRRFLDMTNAGLEEAAAFQRAMEDLGDVDELADYLNSLEPGEPLPGPEEDPRGRIIINADDTVIDLDDLLKNVNAIVKSAVDAAKGAVHQAKSTVRDVTEHIRQDGNYTYTSSNGRVHVDINTDTPIIIGASIKKDPPPEPSEDGEDKQDQEKDMIYGFGYDKAKGGWFAQWGEWKGPKPQTGDEPGESWFHGENAWMEARPDGACSVRGTLRAIDVEVGGDISIRMDETENDDVVIGGDIEDITVDVSADGKLTVRQRNKTASNRFFFSRGLSSADVELTLPRRRWESLRASTVSGDIAVESDESVGTLSVQTVNGDVDGCAGWCEQLTICTVNGDVTWRGGADRASVESVSGDVELEGHFESLRISSVSGDVEFTGDCGANHIECSSMSGDIEVESDVLPLSMELSSKSGDIEARIPDSGPFSVRFKTMSGDISSDFYAGVIRTRRFYFGYGSDQDGVPEGAPVYRMETVSGDVSLKRI